MQIAITKNINTDDTKTSEKVSVHKGKLAKH